MKKTLALIAALVVAPVFANDEPLLDPGAAIGVHLYSLHSEKTYALADGTRRGFNNLNLGAYIRTAAGATLGGYRNSIGKTSFYAGWTKGWDLAPNVEFNVTYGVITGYQKGRMPFVLPSLRVGGVRVVYAPRVNPKDGAQVISVAYERQL
jgi:hypothetical protein